MILLSHRLPRIGFVLTTRNIADRHERAVRAR